MKNFKNKIVKGSEKAMRKLHAVYCAFVCAMAATTIAASADEADEVGQQVASGVISALLTISKYVGIGIVAFGVYEIAMSFMQNQPEAKTKGITMAIVGAILIGLKAMLSSIGVLGDVMPA